MIFQQSLSGDVLHGWADIPTERAARLSAAAREAATGVGTPHLALLLVLSSPGSHFAHSQPDLLVVSDSAFLGKLS